MRAFTKSERDYFELCKSCCESESAKPLASTDISDEIAQQIYNQAAMRVFGFKWRKRIAKIAEFYEPLSKE